MALRFLLTGTWKSSCLTFKLLAAAEAGVLEVVTIWPSGRSGPPVPVLALQCVGDICTLQWLSMDPFCPLFRGILKGSKIFWESVSKKRTFVWERLRPGPPPTGPPPPPQPGPLVFASSSVERLMPATLVAWTDRSTGRALVRWAESGLVGEADEVAYAD